MGGLLNEGIEALFPASEAEGNIVSITRRGRHRPRAPLAFRFFGVMSLFDTTSYHTPKTETAFDSKESGMPLRELGLALNSEPSAHRAG